MEEGLIEMERPYPVLNIWEDRAIPNVVLPEDYKEKIEEFYRCGCREEVEEYVGKLSSLSDIEIRLTWDENLGLKNINLGVHAGLDLDETGGRFTEHNIWSLEQAVPVFLVATKYASLLT